MGFGGDPSQIAQAALTWYGSGAGGRFLLLALLISCAFAGMHVTSWRVPLITLILGGVSWGGTFFFTNWMGWAI